MWFFNTGSELPPANFAGRIGAFIGELSYQMLGYAAYLDPARAGRDRLELLLVPRRWTRPTRSCSARPCSSAASRRSCRWPSARSTSAARSSAPAATSAIGSPAFLADYLNRTGSIILILTLLFAAIILSTQFSFGRLFSALSQMAQERWAALRAALAQRRDEKQREKQRQEVLKKHLGKDAKETKDAKEREGAAQDGRPLVAADRSSPRAAAPTRRLRRRLPASKTAAMVSAAAAALKAASSKPTPPPRSSGAGAVMAAKEPTLPLPEPDKAPVERKKGAFTLPPYALLDAPKPEQKIDERELMDGARLLEEKCREFSVEGTVVQIHPGPSSRPTSSSRTPA